MITLALAASAVALAGIEFDCEAVGKVFAPVDKAEADYRTDYQPVESRGEGDERPARLEEIRDTLPMGELVFLWRREHNSPVTLTIGEYDAAAGTAAYTLGSELNPASRLFTPVSTGGACVARTLGQAS